MTEEWRRFNNLSSLWSAYVDHHPNSYVSRNNVIKLISEICYDCASDFDVEIANKLIDICTAKADEKGKKLLSYGQFMTIFYGAIQKIGVILSPSMTEDLAKVVLQMDFTSVPEFKKYYVPVPLNIINCRVHAFGVKHHKSKSRVKIHSNKISYKSPSHTQSDAIICKGSSAWNPSNGSDVSYFEIKVIKATDAVAIGFTSESTPNDGLPGWNVKSFGFHSDDGKLFLRGKFYDIAKKWQEAGNVAGIGIITATNDIFVTLNGKLVGVANAHEEFKNGLYPSVGIFDVAEVEVILNPEQWKYTKLRVMHLPFELYESGNENSCLVIHSRSEVEAKSFLKWRAMFNKQYLFNGTVSPFKLLLEIWNIILQQLLPKDLLQLSVVSKFFWNLSNQDSLWGANIQQQMHEESLNFNHQKFKYLKDKIGIIPKTVVENSWRIPLKPLIFHYKTIPPNLACKKYWYNLHSKTRPRPPENCWKIAYYDTIKSKSEGLLVQKEQLTQRLMSDNFACVK